MKLAETNDIILNDVELEKIVRELVKKAQEKGVRKANLNKAINIEWDKQKPARNEITIKPEVSEEEVQFALRVRKFMDYYGDIIVKHHSKKEKDERFLYQKDSTQYKYLIENYYTIICGLYGVFLREDKMQQEKVQKFIKEYLSSDYICIGKDITELYEICYERLYFSNPNDLPEYSDDFVWLRDRIDRVQEFIDFKSKYEFSNHKINLVTLALIWLINKYF